MLVLSKLVVVSAYANPPDLQVDALPYTSSTISGRLERDGHDAIVWVEQETRKLYISEIIDGLFTTRLAAEDVSSVAALVDYDGDGYLNIVGSVGGILQADLESQQLVAVVELCGMRAVGDFTGDGLGDYAAPTMLWPGQAGGFREGAAFMADDTETCREVFAVGDLDSDGREDLVRANLTNPYYPYGQLLGTLDLHLGADYAEPVWPARWQYAADYAPGRAVTAADLDGDGEAELLVLAADDNGAGLDGELHVLDDLTSPLGPTRVASVGIGTAVNKRWGVALHNVGDLDADGDDEVLAVMDNLVDGGNLRIIDAEPSEEGLLTVTGYSIELPLPVAEWAMESMSVSVGDYDGNGTRDIAVALTWTDAEEKELSGAIALWLDPTRRDGVGPSLPVLEEEPPTETPRGCGCQSAPGTSYATAALLAALLATSRGRAVGRRAR